MEDQISAIPESIACHATLAGANSVDN
jgi:hypothetical protein